MTHLDRQVIIHLFQGGAVVARDKDDKSKETKKKIDGSLPVFSVDTMEEANQLITLLCKRGYDNESMLLPFSGEYEHMIKVSEMMEEVYTLKKRGYTGEELFAPFVRYKKETGCEVKLP
jgi:hypothetical protein